MDHLENQSLIAGGSVRAENQCDRALVGHARVRADAAGKGAVKKSVVCGFAGERSVSLRNGVLDYKIDFKSFNDGITVFEYLRNNL